MNHKVIPFVLAASVLIYLHSAEAQQPKKVSRIGYLSATPNPGPQVEAFRRGLGELGYIEGKDIQIEYRHIEGKVDRIPTLVAELMKLNVDVFVSPMPPAIRAAKQATKTIPIIMVIPTDPVANGLVDSLAHPGGNVTGLTRLTRELSGKRLELLKEIIPRISRVGVLWDAANDPGLATAFKEHEAPARALQIQLQSLEVRGPNPDLEGVFLDAAKGRVNALIATMTPLLVPYPKRISDLAIKNRLPLMFERSEFVEAGGLMSYSANDAETFRRAAWYVDKILKGTKPADLPVEQPTKFEFVINLKTAKALNLTIPQSVLFRTDKVIK
jgi:putative tryptophan/tyrosine transport system substrate-binding protein